MDRSVETIRYTLKQFDKASRHGDFPRSDGPLSEDAKEKIYQQYRRGTSVDVAGQAHCRTKTSIYRVVNEMRAKRILELPLDYIDNRVPQGDDERERRPILGPMPEDARAHQEDAAPAGCRRTWRRCTRCRC
jgi:RNA polymerase primary sigma factor